MAAPAIETALREFVRTHRVCWELQPHQEVWQHERRQMGVDVTLFARVFSLAEDPGSERSLAVYEALREVALRVMPSGSPAVHCEIAPFNASFRLRPESYWIPEIELTIEVVHQGDAPAGTRESDLAHGIEHRLQELGARPRQWGPQTRAA